MVFLSNQIESKHFSTRSANVLRREKIETNEALIELALSGTVGRLEKVGDCTQKELETAAAKLTEKITLHREEVMLGEITAFFPDAAGVSALYAEFAELQKKWLRKFRANSNRYPFGQEMHWKTLGFLKMSS